jgi:hypothetical protein
VSDSFDSQEQLKSLITGTKIQLESGLECDLDEGWFRLLQELVMEIKDLSIRIYEIDTSHGELDVRFIAYADEDVSVAWQIAQEKRLDSRSSCSKCGGYGLSLVFDLKHSLLCKACEKESPKLGVTGTWLDQY